MSYLEIYYTGFTVGETCDEFENYNANSMIEICHIISVSGKSEFPKEKMYIASHLSPLSPMFSKPMLNFNNLQDTALEKMNR